MDSTEVIEFITKFKFKNGPDGVKYVEDTFGNGYCYYFALMLKEAFQRGELKWHRNHSHIVWMDINGISYDIYGPFKDYNDGDLVSISVLGELIKDFKHIPYTIYFSEDFEKEADKYNISSSYLVKKIYMNIIPKEEYDDTKTVIELVKLFWENQKDIKEKIERMMKYD